MNKSVCDLDDVICSIQASTRLQEKKLDSLETISKNVENFIADVVRIDEDAAEAINRNKDEFYDTYNYLKPDCEKNLWEKFCDGLASAAEWCKEHWKLIVTVVLVIASAAVIVLSGGMALPAILTMMAQGTLIGAVSGGLLGGISSILNGGSFWDGVEEGAFSGAIGGAIFGGIGGAGQMLGKGISCLSNLGKFIKGVSVISGVINSGMAAFDTAAMLALLIDGENNWLYSLNSKLHSNALYNGFQIGVSALAVFTGGMSQTMTCFVAGTMILTVAGVVAIEQIKAGDKVISTDPRTFETAEKSVLETYVRRTDKLIHLVINGEETVTTETHPFYVKGYGFVDAGNLQVGDCLLDMQKKELSIEGLWVECLDEPETVYNFQVDDFHTYHVGNCGVLVHNADYSNNLIPNKKEGLRREQEVQTDLKKRYPESEGYKVENEKLLRDSNGKKALDPETGTGRRIDFVVDKDGNIVDSIEVTSTTADKSAQIAKELRIRQNGGNYIRLDDGRLVKIPQDIVTRIERRN